MLSVCEQDHAKVTGPIFMKLCGDVYHGPKKNALNSGADPYHGSNNLVRYVIFSRSFLIFRFFSNVLGGPRESHPLKKEMEGAGA